MKYRSKDKNQNSIVQELTQAGYSVCDLSAVGYGLTDLLVGGVDRRDGIRKNWLMEVKTEKGKLNPLQQEWHAAWRGQKQVVRTPNEALLVVGVLEHQEAKNA
jgi:hypothetical protein